MNQDLVRCLFGIVERLQERKFYDKQHLLILLIDNYENYVYRTNKIIPSEKSFLDFLDAFLDPFTWFSETVIDSVR